MKDVFELEPKTFIDQDNSYIISYPYIIDHFQAIKEFSEQDFICCAHIVYGWMPTILDLNPNKRSIGLKRGADLLGKAKKTGELADNEIDFLSKLVNNSLVGTSKLLHFTSPNSFAMWDSKIYSFVFEEKPHNYRVNQLEKYREYMSRIDQIRRQPRFHTFHQSVKEKVGYEVSEIRAIELVMFLNSG